MQKVIKMDVRVQKAQTDSEAGDAPGSLELQAEHSDRPEPSATDEDEGEERLDTATDLGILRPVGAAGPRKAWVV